MHVTMKAIRHYHFDDFRKQITTYFDIQIASLVVKYTCLRHSVQASRPPLDAFDAEEPCETQGSYCISIILQYCTLPLRYERYRINFYIFFNFGVKLASFWQDVFFSLDKRTC